MCKSKRRSWWRDVKCVKCYFFFYISSYTHIHTFKKLMSLAYKTNRIERCCTFSVPIIRNFFCENVTYNLLQKIPWNWTFNWYLVTTNVLSRYNMYKCQSDLKFDPICRSCHTSDSHDMSLWHKWYGVYRIWCEKKYGSIAASTN